MRIGNPIKFLPKLKLFIVVHCVNGYVQHHSVQSKEKSLQYSIGCCKNFMVIWTLRFSKCKTHSRRDSSKSSGGLAAAASATRDSRFGSRTTSRFPRRSCTPCVDRNFLRANEGKVEGLAPKGWSKVFDPTPQVRKWLGRPTARGDESQNFQLRLLRFVSKENSMTHISPRSKQTKYHVTITHDS